MCKINYGYKVPIDRRYFLKLLIYKYLTFDVTCILISHPTLLKLKLFKKKSLRWKSYEDTVGQCV